METKIERGNINDTELRSTGVQSLLNKHPHWLVIKGNFLISVILIIFLVLTGYSVKYPEFVRSKITITSQNHHTKSKNLTGLLTVSKNDSKKIKINQKVIIKLYDYSYEEFGIVEGKVQNISNTPDDKGNYYVNVILPKGFKTSYNKTLPSDKKLKGNAEVVTKDSRLIEKILYQKK